MVLWNVIVGVNGGRRIPEMILPIVVINMATFLIRIMFLILFL
jgi:hypothetical protein